MSTSFEELLGSPPPLDPTTAAEFDDAFLHPSSSFFLQARKRAKHGLASSSLRSLHWRLFLDLLSPERVDLWQGQLDLQRRQYEQLLTTYKVTPSAHEEKQKEQDEKANAAPTDDPSHTTPTPFPPLPSPPPSTTPAPPTDLKINNPLSTSSSSPWRQYFHSSELSQLITADLVRTHPESGFFQSDSIQSLMLNVLLVWAKLNPQYEYRQGMNELLAPLVLVVFKDCRAVVDPSPSSSTSSSSSSPPSSSFPSPLSALLDRHYAEHDVFALFRQLMTTMAPFFAKIDQKPQPRPSSTTIRTSSPSSSSAEDDLLIGPPPPPPSHSPILLKCHHIHHDLLSALDPALYKQLNAQQVQPQLYGLRWYRLLFAREFHVIDVCQIWDVLFSQQSAVTTTTGMAGGAGGGGGGGYVMADYFCVAMLHYVRQELLKGDNTDCLRRLLKFPPVESIRSLVDRALYFATPNTHRMASGGMTPPPHAPPSFLDQPAVHAHHSEMQRFIAEWGSELENSYLEDPLGFKRGGQVVVDGMKGGVEALMKKGGRGKEQAKTMPAINGSSHSHTLQHSASQGSLVTALSTLPPPQLKVGGGQGQTQLAGKVGGGTVHVDRVAQLTAVQVEMGQKLQAVIHTLTKEWERLHKLTSHHPPPPPSSISSPSPPSSSAPSHDSESDHPIPSPSLPPPSDAPTVELEATPSSHPHTNGLPPSPLPPSSSSGPSMDVTVLSDSLADLKHIADVLLGRLAYTPQQCVEVEDEGVGGAGGGGGGGGGHSVAASPSSSVASSNAVVLSPANAGGTSTFFVPKSVEDPKERLQRLLIEKERDAHQGQAGGAGEGGLTNSMPHSASSPLTYAVALPAALPPKRLSVVPSSSHPRTASPKDVPLPAASSPSSAPAVRVVSSVSPPLAPSGPSLFDASPAVSGQRSAHALLSSLLGGEKKSVFNDD